MLLKSCTSTLAGSIRFNCLYDTLDISLVAFHAQFTIDSHLLSPVNSPIARLLRNYVCMYAPYLSLMNRSASITAHDVAAEAMNGTNNPNLDTFVLHDSI